MATKKIGRVKKTDAVSEYTTLSLKQIANFVSTLKQGERIEIKWIDAFSERGWKPAPEMNTAHPCAVTGYYINCQDAYLRIGINKAIVTDDQWCTYSDHWGIPLGMIYSLSKG